MFGETKKDMGHGYEIRRDFWTQLLNYANTKTNLHEGVSYSQPNWMQAGAGMAGLGYAYGVTQHGSTVVLSIDRGKERCQENKSIFDQLAASKEDIERAFGGSLDWKRKDDCCLCRIIKELPLGGYRDDPSEWPAIHRKMVDTMIRLERAFRPHIQKLKLSLTDI